MLITVAYNLVFNWKLGFGVMFFKAMGFTLLFALVLSRHKWLFLLGVPALLLPSAMAAFFVNKFNVKISVTIISVLMETTRAEAAEFISVGFIFWMILAAVASIGLVWGNLYLARRYSSKRDWYLEMCLFVILFAVLFFCIHPVNRMRREVVALVLETALFIAFFKGMNLWEIIKTKKIRLLLAFVIYSALVIWLITSMKAARRFHPFDFTVAVSRHFDLRDRLLESIANRKDIADYPSTFDERRGKDLNIVLILGESARSDHFQINGYHRDTTPKLVNRKNVIAYKDVEARSATTRIAVPNILTRATTSEYDELGKETSFLSLFRKHGFYTAWLSMNDVYGKYNISTSSYAESADFKYFRRDHEVTYEIARDDYLLPIYKKILKRHQSGKLFVVLHTRGSHWRHDQRYPAAFEKFPVRGMVNTPSECHQRSLINAYDNSIVFTDYIIDQVMEAVRDRNALVVYISDHGESIGENGVYGHGQDDRPEQMRVPLIWWGTPKFIQNYGESYERLKRNTAGAVSQDHFFHSLLDLTGFKTEVIDKKLSLIRW